MTLVLSVSSWTQMQRHINTLLFRKRPTRGQPPPMAGHVSGQPRSPGDVRGDRETRFTEHGANGWPGYWPASVTRACMGLPGDTIYKTWSTGQPGNIGATGLLADLCRPGMYGATGPCPLDDALMRFDEVHDIRLKRGCKFDLFV